MGSFTTCRIKGKIVGKISLQVAYSNSDEIKLGKKEKSGKLEVISLKNLLSKMPKLLKVLPTMRLPILNFNNCPQLLRSKK